MIRPITRKGLTAGLILEWPTDFLIEGFLSADTLGKLDTFESARNFETLGAVETPESFGSIEDFGRIEGVGNTDNFGPVNFGASNLGAADVGETKLFLDILIINKINGIPKSKPIQVDAAIKLGDEFPVFAFSLAPATIDNTGHIINKIIGTAITNKSI